MPQPDVHFQLDDNKPAKEKSASYRKTGFTPKADDPGQHDVRFKLDESRPDKSEKSKSFRKTGFVKPEAEAVDALMCCHVASSAPSSTAPSARRCGCAV